MALQYDNPAAIRQGEQLDVAQLETFLKTQLPDLLGNLQVQQFPSGYSNLTYFLRFDNAEMVLRRPPFGANIKGAHDMAREYNILKTLFPIYPKVPQPLVYSNDESVLGAEFYVMQRVQGTILRQKAPEGMTTQQIRQVSTALIENLAQLHSIDIESTGLINIGKPEGYVKRQVEGWIARYQKAATDDLADMNSAAAWLIDNIPPESKPTLIHNDYKYDNVMLNPNDLSEVLAVLDWEMATVGEPLMDLGTTLAYWADDKSPEALRKFSLTSFEGNLNREDVAQLYAQKSGRDISNIVFYYVFGCFKVAVIGQQIYARFQKGLTQDQRFASLIYLVRACAQSATKAIDKGSIMG